MDNYEILNKLVDDIISGNNVDAKDGFDSVLSNKIVDSLDQRKVELAQTIYNDEDQQEEEEQDQ